MVFKLPKPKRRVNEKMTLEALHKAAETYREMYDDIRKKNDILQKQLDIAIECLKTAINLACPYFPVKTAKADSFHQLKNIQKKCGIALQKIEELNK